MCVRAGGTNYSLFITSKHYIHLEMYRTTVIQSGRVTARKAIMTVEVSKEAGRSINLVYLALRNVSAKGCGVSWTWTYLLSYVMMMSFSSVVHTHLYAWENKIFILMTNVWETTSLDIMGSRGPTVWQNTTSMLLLRSATSHTCNLELVWYHRSGKFCC